jgi:Spy/CpxP family protein refolding chaperone
MLQICSRQALKYGLITGAVFAVFASASCQLNAQPRGGDPGFGMNNRPGLGRGMGGGIGAGMGGGMGHASCDDDDTDITNYPLWRNLELSAKQQSDIQSLHTTFCADTESLRDRAEADRDTTHDLFTSDASRADLERQYQEMTANMTDFRDRMFTMMLDVRDVLTPEQREQFSEMMGDRMMGDHDMMDDFEDEDHNMMDDFDNEDHDRFRGGSGSPMMHDHNFQDGS